MSQRTISDLIPDEAVARAEQIIGHTFADKHLIRTAITHPSANAKPDVDLNYERMEFLGDSILGAIVADELYKRYEDLDEGGLTRIKVALVAGSTLSQVALDAGLGDVIIFGDSEMGSDRRGLHSALENVFEAVVAALYLDGGIEVARAWVLSMLSPHMSHDLAAEPESPKSSLQEHLQAHQKHPVYAITDFDGPPHNRVFHAEVSVDDEVLGCGTGHSKKEAEAHAASAALEKLGV